MIAVLAVCTDQRKTCYYHTVDTADFFAQIIRRIPIHAGFDVAACNHLGVDIFDF